MEKYIVITDALKELGICKNNILQNYNENWVCWNDETLNNLSPDSKIYVLSNKRFINDLIEYNPSWFKKI